MLNLKAVPAFRFLLSLISGILISEVIKVSTTLFFSIFLVVLLVSFYAILKPKFKLIRHFVSLLFFLIGFFVQKINKQNEDPNHILNQKNIEAYLVNINSQTETKPKTYKCIAEILAFKKEGKWLKSKGKTLLYFNKNTNVYPEFGQIYLIKGAPRVIDPPKNPVEFNYKKFQARKNIYTHQFLKTDDFIYTGKQNFKPLFAFANRLNLYTHAVFKSALDNQKQIGVADALVAGMKSDLDYELRQAYTDAGAIHVLAVSGMHVGILFWIIGLIFGLFMDKKRAYFHILVIAVLWIYALYSGLSPSVCRATLMFTLFQIGSALNRDYNPINTLGLSALILLIINPNWFYDVGFQLSYLAVLGILLVYPPLKKIFEIQNIVIRWLWEVTAVSFAAQLFTFPLSIFYFHQFPNHFLIANPGVAAISFGILPLGLLLLLVNPIPIFGPLVAFLFKLSIIVLNKFVEIIQLLPFSVTRGLEISFLTLILLQTLVFLSFAFFSKKEIKYLKLITLVIIILTFTKITKVNNQNKQKELTFHFIPSGIGVTVLQGRNALFISSDTLINNSTIYQYHLKNYHDHAGVKNYYTRSIKNNTFLQISNSNLKIHWLISKPSKTIPIDLDYLLCSNNALKDLELLQNFEGMLVLDGSNKKWIIDKLKMEAKAKNIKLLTLYDSGSKTFKF